MFGKALNNLMHIFLLNIPRNCVSHLYFKTTEKFAIAFSKKMSSFRKLIPQLFPFLLQTLNPVLVNYVPNAMRNCAYYVSSMHKGHAIISSVSFQFYRVRQQKPDSQIFNSKETF